MTYYYAFVNSDNIVTGVYAMPTPITNDGYIPITQDQYENGNLVGKMYDASTGQFITPPAWACSSDNVQYKSTTTTLSDKLDEIETSIDSKPNTSDLHQHINKAVLDGITFAKVGTTNNPKTTEGWRFLVHKTTDLVGWVQAFGSSGSMFLGTVDSDCWKGWKCIYDADPAPLWTGKLYMAGTDSTPQTVTPSKKLSECRNGWLLLWSDYDPDTSTANDADFATTIIPKSNATGGKWNGKSFLCDIPRYIGSNVNDVDTERRIMKILYIYDNYIKGSPNNNKDDRNDVVLRAVYEI